jgi:hypothetical protein
VHTSEQDRPDVVDVPASVAVRATQPWRSAHLLRDAFRMQNPFEP